MADDDDPRRWVLQAALAADAKTEKDKQALLASMDGLAARWRARTAAAGKPVPAPVPIVAQVAAVTAPNVQGGANGQPGGQLGATAAATPVRRCSQSRTVFACSRDSTKPLARHS